MSNPYKTIALPSAIEQNDGLDGVPLTMLPSRISRCIASKKTLRQISFQSGQTSGPGQTSIVSLPYNSNSGYAISGSFYIYFKLVATQVAGGTWGFAGSAGSASALINRLTISNGSVIESINNYNLVATNLIQPFSMSNAMNLDSVCGGSFGENNNTSIPYRTSLTTQAIVNSQATQYDSSAGTDFYKYTIPIISGYLNGGSEQNVIPLELMNSPLQISLDWSTISQAFFATVSPTAYAISELSLIYETVDIGRDYTQGLRTAMASGKFWSTPISTIVSIQTQYLNSLNFNMALNSSSVDAFFYGVINTASTQNLATTNKFFSASAGSTAVLDSSNIQRRLFADGDSVYNLSLYNSDSLLVRELVRCLSGVVNSDSIKMPFNVAGNVGLAGSFRGNYYIASFNLRSFADASVCMSGRAVSVLNLQTSETTPTALTGGEVVTMFAVVSLIVVLDGSGAISLVR